MPQLVRMYIKSVLFGFGLAAMFVFALLYTNIGNLWHLISTSDIGWIAVIMLVFFNGIVFAGVQFAISVMRMEEDDEPRGGKRVPVATTIPAPIEAVAAPRRKLR